MISGIINYLQFLKTMRILVIAYNVDNSATGLVVNSLLKQIWDNSPETTVLCNKYSHADKIPEKVFEIKGNPFQYNRLAKLFLVLTNVDPNSFSWVRKGLRLGKKAVKEKRPDVILTITSAYCFPLLKLGYELSKKHKIPHFIHTVDPIPSHPGWGENYRLRNSIAKLISPYFRTAVGISATNEAMLEYQKKVVGERFINNAFVVSNPCYQDQPVLERPVEPHSFAYLGNIYGKRNPQLLIDAFTEFASRNNKAKLYFVGHFQAGNVSIPETMRDRILITGWTDSPEEYIKKCGVLIDIDADIPGDVFMSSKLINYLSNNRMILCISPKDSPARKLLAGLPESTATCSHNFNEIVSGLNGLISMDFNNQLFAERISIRESFKPASVVSKFIKELSKGV